MKISKLCKETLDALCKSDDVHDLSDIPEDLVAHIKTCKQCSSYRKSLTGTIDLYRKYDITLEKDIKKKLLCNTCSKLKSETS